jgi:hypothetical protein
VLLVDTTAAATVQVEVSVLFCNSITDCDEVYKRYKCDAKLLVLSYVLAEIHSSNRSLLHLLRLREPPAAA